MKEHGMIFQGWGIRAIQNCKPGVWPAEPIDPSKPWKWQTRRVMKCPPPEGADEVHVGDVYGRPVATYRPAPNHAARWALCKCPYGIPGDRLWVRETWGVFSRSFGGARAEHPGPWLGLQYRATDEMDSNDDDHAVQVERSDWLRYRKPSRWQTWKPSIHMPRWAARLILEVKSIRVERVQDISEDDIWAEGLDRVEYETWLEEVQGVAPGGSMFERPIDLFAHLWNSINKKRGFGWEVNPWNWVVDFMRTVHTEAEMKGIRP